MSSEKYPIKNFRPEENLPTSYVIDLTWWRFNSNPSRELRDMRPIQLPYQLDTMLTEVGADPKSAAKGIEILRKSIAETEGQEMADQFTTVLTTLLISRRQKRQATISLYPWTPWSEEDVETFKAELARLQNPEPPEEPPAPVPEPAV